MRLDILGKWLIKNSFYNLCTTTFKKVLSQKLEGMSRKSFLEFMKNSDSGKETQSDEFTIQNSETKTKYLLSHLNISWNEISENVFHEFFVKGM